MWGLPFFLQTDEQRAWEKRMREAAIRRRLANVIDWSPDIKWMPELNISGASYMSQIRRLFDVTPSKGVHPSAIPDAERVTSPCGRWFYCEKILPRGYMISTVSGRREGSVMFDTDVVIPALHEVGHRDTNPWMSLTPMEIITLRGGTRLAKGHVVVAGLGLGHQLIEVSLRKQVKKLTLVERSDALVKFIMPRVEKFLGCPVEVVVGNAYDLIPKMKADVALVDIFAGYGGNEFCKCPNIGRVWCWGSVWAA